jgi:hypothetical protein
LDHSKPDFKLYPPVGEYKWINDNYIIFINFIYGIPYIVKVDDSFSEDIINVFYELGITQEEYPIHTEDYNLRINQTDDNLIIIEDESEGKTYKINYSFDEKGLINLTVAN